MTRVTETLLAQRPYGRGLGQPVLDVSRGGPPGWSPEQHIPMKQTPVEAGSLKEFPNVRAAIIVALRDNTILMRKFSTAQMFEHVRQLLSDCYTVGQLETMEAFLSTLDDDRFVRFALDSDEQHELDDPKNTSVMLGYLAHHLEFTL